MSKKIVLKTKFDPLDHVDDYVLDEITEAMDVAIEELVTKSGYSVDDIDDYLRTTEITITVFLKKGAKKSKTNKGESNG